MKLLIAKDAGYCFGVRDAVNKAYDAAKENGASLFGMATALVLDPYCVPKINKRL